MQLSGVPEVVRIPCRQRHTNYFETGEILRSRSLIQPNASKVIIIRATKAKFLDHGKLKESVPMTIAVTVICLSSSSPWSKTLALPLEL